MSGSKRIGDREAIQSLVDEMLRIPPHTPADLQLRIAAFDGSAVRREMARKLLDTDADADAEFHLIQWLVELNPKRAAVHLLEALGDTARPVEKRAVAVIVLSSAHERELHRRMSDVPHAQQLQIMLAAQEWLAKQASTDESAPAQPAGGRRPAPSPRPRRKAATKRSRVVRLKVTLRHIRPPIWRRVEVRDDLTLARLHHVLQVALGWTDSHLHAFQVGNTTYGVPDPEWPNDTVSEKKVTLRELAVQGVKRFLYEYDFGDGWEHDIVIERTGEPEAGAKYPRCLTGRRACPPEDCGGPWGYEELLRTLADPEHPDHEEMREWAGELDPESFDVESVNRELRRLR